MNICNNPDYELNVKDQQRKFIRAIKLILRTDITPDEYIAILQLMNSVDIDTCLVLDNTYENV